MNQLLKAAAVAMSLVLAVSAQTITNVKFTDLNGKAWDLYTLLSEGKYVLVHASGAN